MIHPVVLCGGTGTRLWPVSRQGYPKQFARLIGDRSLFQMTLERFLEPDFAAPLVMTENDFRFMVMEQCGEIGLSDARVVVEPARRDTAPAILSAALLLAQDDPDGFMLVAPSDHVIGDIASFHRAIQTARAAAEEAGALITFGITPDRPETGYGYLELAQIPPQGTAATLNSFREKPDLQTAQQMLSDGNYLWNAGIFLFRIKDVIAAFEAHAPTLVPACTEAVKHIAKDLDFLRLGPAYEGIKGVSFDYAVMENAARVMVVPLSNSWSDLGSWDALWTAGEPDADGTAVYGAVTALDCHDSYLRSEDNNLHLVGLGLSGVVAVAMRDAVLIADKSRVQEVKTVVDILRKAKVAQADQYPRFHRPWGWYETLSVGNRFQVKQIMVKPGGMLSLQSHHHRAEHWVVVEGTAKTLIDGETRLVTENESIYIPLGAQHRLSNPGKLPMYLIEVQTGSYLQEDDITRHDDIYNRR